MARLVGLDQPADDLGLFGLDDRLAQFFHQFRVEPALAADKARVEQRGQHLVILAAQAQAFLEAAGGVPHVHAGVPQRVDDFANQPVGLLGQLVFEKQHQVDVTLQALLSPAVAAQGDDRVRIAHQPDARPDHAGFETPLEIVVQQSGQGSQGIIHLAAQDTGRQGLAGGEKTRGGGGIRLMGGGVF